MPSLPEAQAETGVFTAARAPTYRLICAAGAFGISIGTASGETRRGPFSLSDVVVVEQRGDAADAGGHRDPDAGRRRGRRTPGRRRGRSRAQASMAATIANCEERSRRRALTRSSTSVGSTAIRPAILTGISSAQSSVEVADAGPTR